MRSRGLAVAQVDAHSASRLADMITRNSLDSIRIGKASREASRQIGFEPDEDTTGGPPSKLARAEGRAEIVEQIGRFGALVGGANVLRSCDLSLEFVAAGPRCLGFRPSEGVAPKVSAQFASARTPQQYSSHLKRAGALFGCGLDWRTRAVAQSAEDFVRSGDRINALEPAVARALLAKILTTKNLPDAFVPAVWVSWSFLLRAQSECLPLGGQLPSESVGED